MKYPEMKITDTVWLTSFWPELYFQAFTGQITTKRNTLLGPRYYIQYAVESDNGSYYKVTRRMWWRIWQ